MKNVSDTPEVKKRKFPTTLQILTSIYALLYLVFIIDNFLPAKGFNPYDLENSIVKLLFALFLVGYYFSWKNEGVAGLIFVIWWIGMWCLALFVAKIDRGAGVVMGLPLFVLAILFMVSWYRKSRKSR
jgi:hypothetical protein